MTANDTHPGVVDEELLARLKASPAPYAALTDKLAWLGKALTTPDQPDAVLDWYVRRMADVVATYFAWEDEREAEIHARVAALNIEAEKLADDLAGREAS